MVSRRTRRFARHYTTTDIAGRHKCRPYSSKPTWLDLIKVAPTLQHRCGKDRGRTGLRWWSPAAILLKEVSQWSPAAVLLKEVDAVVSVRGTIPFPLRRGWAYDQGM